MYLTAIAIEALGSSVNPHIYQLDSASHPAVPHNVAQVEEKVMIRTNKHSAHLCTSLFCSPYGMVQ